MDTHSISTEVLSMPKTWTTRTGFAFCPQDEKWLILDTSSPKWFDFNTLTPFCKENLIYSLKKVFLWYLKQMSVSHAGNMFNRFKHFMESVVQPEEQISEITAIDLMNYRGLLNESNEWYLGSLVMFLKRLFDFGYGGITPEAYFLLKNSRGFKHNRKGHLVLTQDPEEGPFTEIEFKNIQRLINTAFSSGDISYRQFCLAWLLITTGARPVQIAELKVKDLVVNRENPNNVTYTLNVPRAKQRNQPKRWAFTPRHLNQELGKILEAWIAQIVLFAPKGIKESAVTAELPMFPRWWTSNAPGFENHITAQTLTKELQKTFSSLDAKSYRIEKMHITPTRFRYTLGTRAAQEGFGALIIAMLLDHVDTQNVQCYVKCTPEVMKRLDKALAEELAPLADLFAGKVGPKNCDANPVSVVRLASSDPAKGGVGNCGGCGDCFAVIPVACYVCPDFFAWLEGPHEEVLTTLLEERRRILEETGDERISFANDDIILAVTQVIQLCKELQESA